MAPIQSTDLRDARTGGGFAERHALSCLLARIHEQTVPPLLGRFRLAERLGSGAHGEVYDAWDLRLERRVALKVITDPDHRALDEARALARLDNPGVVGVHELIEDDECTMVVMQYVEGADADAWAVGRSSSELLRLMAQVAEALHAVHAAGLVHGDVKPSNLRVDVSGRGTLIDFSLASERPEGPRGTPRFMAPEARVDGPTARSDQYSFFRMLEVLLGGEPPDLDARARLKLAQTEQRAITRLPQRGLARIVARGTCVRPEARHVSMAAVATALRGTLVQRQRRVVAFSLAALGALVTVGAGGWAQLRAHRCESKASPLQIWSPEERNAIAAADLPQGTSIEALVGRIDTAVTGWSAQVRAECDALGWYADPKPPSPCLEDGKRRLKLIVSKTAEDPARALIHANALLQVLPDTDSCHDDPQLRWEGGRGNDVEQLLGARDEVRRLQLGVELDASSADAQLDAFERDISASECAWQPDVLILRADQAFSRTDLEEAVGLAAKAAAKAEVCERPTALLRARSKIATLHARAGNHEAADAWLPLVEAAARRHPSRDEFWRVEHARGLVSYAKGDVQLALRFYERAEAELARVGRTDPDVSRVRLALLGMTGAPTVDEELASFVETQIESRGPSHPSVARALEALGNAYVNRRQLDKGAALLRRSLGIYELWDGALETERSALQLNLATALQVSDPQQSAALLRSYVAWTHEKLPSNPVLGEALAVLALVYWRLEQPEDAVKAARDAVDALKGNSGPDDPSTLQAESVLGRLVAATGKSEAGVELACRAAQRLFASENQTLVIAPGVLRNCLTALELHETHSGEGLAATQAWLEPALETCTHGACRPAHRLYAKLRGHDVSPQ